MTAVSPKQAVSIALKAMQANQADREVAQALIAAGVIGVILAFIIWRFVL
jgi:hypothetical protein